MWCTQPKAGISAVSPKSSVLPLNVPTGVGTELETALVPVLYSALKAKWLPSCWVASAGLSSRPPRVSMGSATPAPPMELLTAPTPWSVWPSPA